MKKLLLALILASVIPLSWADGNIFRAKLNVDQSENAVLSQDGLFYLPAYHVQKSDGILFEAEQVSTLDYHIANSRLQMEKDCISILNVRSMTFLFDVLKSGNYRAWYRASYPTLYPYNHRERMDDGELSPLISDSDNLPPNIWRWHMGPLYHLEKGKHIWSFPSPSAWCGGSKLDKLLLLPENLSAAEAEKSSGMETEVCIPEHGKIVLRKIKTKLFRKWKMNAEMQLNGGKFTAEYRYDGQSFKNIEIGSWETVPAGVRYLYLQFRLDKAEKAKISPFVYNLEIQIQEE